MNFNTEDDTYYTDEEWTSSNTYEQYSDEADKEWSFSTEGQFSVFESSGYYIEADRDTSLSEYRNLMEDALATFTHAGARATRVSWTMYHKSLDLWFECIVLFEFGIDTQVILSKQLVNAFQPNLYETS